MSQPWVVIQLDQLQILSFLDFQGVKNLMFEFHEFFFNIRFRLVPDSVLWNIVWAS
jgi:hypothetical protein